MNYEIAMCVDCAQVEANGEPYVGNTGGWGAYGDYGPAEAAQYQKDNWSGWQVTIGDEEPYFSKSRCDWCGSPYGGDRFPATAWKKDDRRWLIRFSNDLNPDTYAVTRNGVSEETLSRAEADRWGSRQEALRELDRFLSNGTVEEDQ